jgi:hypothetical protein
MLVKILPLFRQPHRHLRLGFLDASEFVPRLDAIAVHAGRNQILVIFRSAPRSRVKVVNRQVTPCLERSAKILAIYATKFISLKNPKVSLDFSRGCHVGSPVPLLPSSKPRGSKKFPSQSRKRFQQPLRQSRHPLQISRITRPTIEPCRIGDKMRRVGTRVKPKRRCHLTRRFSFCHAILPRTS